MGNIISLKFKKKLLTPKEILRKSVKKILEALKDLHKNFRIINKILNIFKGLQKTLEIFK